METKIGIIISIIFKRGFGFIKDREGQEYFFHATAVLDPDFKELKTGMEVNFYGIEDVRNRERLVAIGVTNK